MRQRRRQDAPAHPDDPRDRSLEPGEHQHDRPDVRDGNRQEAVAEAEERLAQVMTEGGWLQ